LYQDKSLTCRDCGKSFTFSAGEQEFFAAKGFSNEPTRCPPCRETRKNQRPPRENFTATCARCGGPAEVPFRPTGDKPVYCNSCFQDKKNGW